MKRFKVNCRVRYERMMASIGYYIARLGNAIGSGKITKYGTIMEIRHAICILSIAIDYLEELESV